MIYKKATKLLRENGIKHIVIKKGMYGPYPDDPRILRQKSMCFKTATQAAHAVINGFRPTETPKSKNEADCSKGDA